MPQRKKLIIDLNIPANRYITFVHPTAVISQSAIIQHGSLIGSFVTIQPGVSIGAFNSIQAGANIGHDAVTKDFCYIGPNATMTGKSMLMEGSHLGPNAVITDGVVLEEFSIAGAGAAIMKHTMPYSIYIGNPARRIVSLE